MSLALAVPQRNPSEEELIRSARRERAARAAWSATFHTRVYNEKPAPATSLWPPIQAPGSEPPQPLRAPTRRSLNIRAPIPAASPFKATFGLSNRALVIVV